MRHSPEKISGQRSATRGEVSLASPRYRSGFSFSYIPNPGGTNLSRDLVKDKKVFTVLCKSPQAALSHVVLFLIARH